MGAITGRAIPAVLISVGLVAGLPRLMPAQEGSSSCRLVSITAISQERTEAGVDKLFGNVRAKCGDATMAADSAFVRERAPGEVALVRLLRNVDYRDSTRSLTSDSLRYTGADDRIVAMGNVVLTMTESGVKLSGPRVEFHRVSGAGAERTIATDRPHLDLEGDGADGGPPTTVDADRIEMFREENAWTFGDVVITRPDVISYADSAFFDMVGGTGILHGSARVVGEDFELTGDSVRIEFEAEELDAVHAFEGAKALGSDFEIASSQIRIGVIDGEVDDVQAFGGRSAALSAGYHLLGDSLRFRLRDGTMDSTFAIGRAVALEDTTAALLDEPLLTVSGDKGWLAGDTIVASFRPASTTDSGAVPGQPAAAAPDSGDADGAVPAEAAPIAADTGEQVRDAELEKLRTAGSARAYYLAIEEGETGPPGRNYLIGKEISVFFEEGRAVRVAAGGAIGVYLDPDPNAPPPLEGAAEVEGGPPGEALPGEAAVKDSVGAARDTIQAVGDSLRAAPDTTQAAGDSLRAPPDTMQAPAAADSARRLRELPGRNSP